ncbi:hypothetical protein ABWK46_24340 [Peribacillus frigoritolerans]
MYDLVHLVVQQLFKRATKSGFANAQAPTGATSQGLLQSLHQSFQEGDQNGLLVMNLATYRELLLRNRHFLSAEHVSKLNLILLIQGN